MMKLAFTAFHKYSIVIMLVVFSLMNLSCEDSAVGPRLKLSSQQAWKEMESGTNANLHDVWGVDANHVFAVGDNGTILYYNGAAWFKMYSGTTENLLAIWGCGLRTIFAGGENGTILLFDGLHWVQIESGTNGSIKAIWGAFEEECNIHYAKVFALAGGSPGEILMFDCCDKFVSWRSLPSEPATDFLNILGNMVFQYFEFDMAVVGRGGAAYFGDYDGWRKSETGTTDDLFALMGVNLSNLYAVGSNGNIYQNTKRWLEDPPSRTWRQVGSLGGGELYDIAARSYNDIFIVGAGPRIVHFDRGTFTDMEINARSTLRGVWADDTHVYAVGDDGVILMYADPPSVNLCPINVTISVTDDPMPVVSWTPNCPVSKLFVERWGGDIYELSWFIAADGNLIEPDVQYGTIPDNTLELCPPSWLLNGNLYRMSLIWRDWDTEILIGSWNFIPSDSQSNGFMTIAEAEARGTDDWLSLASAIPTGSTYGTFYFPRLRPIIQKKQTVPGQSFFNWGSIGIFENRYWPWVGDPAEREDLLNIRPVIVQKLDVDPDTGWHIVISCDYYRAADPYYDSNILVVWDILRQ